MVGWLRDSTERSLREALTVASPGLAALPMVLLPKASQPSPLYWSGSAVVAKRFVVKFAWAEAPAIRVWREGLLMERLAAAKVPVPRVLLVQRDPALVISEFVAGSPMTWEWASSRDPGDTARIGRDLGAFLAGLHAVPPAQVLHGLPLFMPTPQADTERLRTHYPALIDEHRAQTVRQWCDWVDDVLASREPDLAVLVHGDFHGHNQLWDHQSRRLVSVVDFEESGVGEPEYDLRYLPGNSCQPELVP